MDREPVTVAELIAALGPRLGRGTVLEAVEALRRRSLVERAETAGRAAFTLQSVVLEYVIDRLVEEVPNEIARGQPVLLVDQPLITRCQRTWSRSLPPTWVRRCGWLMLKTRLPGIWKALPAGCP